MRNPTFVSPDSFRIVGESDEVFATRRLSMIETFLNMRVSRDRRHLVAPTVSFLALATAEAIDEPLDDYDLRVVSGDKTTLIEDGIACLDAIEDTPVR